MLTRSITSTPCPHHMQYMGPRSPKASHLAGRRSQARCCFCSPVRRCLSSIFCEHGGTYGKQLTRSLHYSGSSPPSHKLGSRSRHVAIARLCPFSLRSPCCFVSTASASVISLHSTQLDSCLCHCLLGISHGHRSLSALSLSSARALLCSLGLRFQRLKPVKAEPKPRL